MAYCLNPDCSNPHNPQNNPFCQGCGLDLRQSAISFNFRYRFHITKLLGQGGFGRTYLAQDLDDIHNRPCVVKKLIASEPSEQRIKKELFFKEANQLNELKHPQIPKLYSYFEHNNALYLIQEHIEGWNLREELERQGKFSPEKIIDLLQQTLPILQYIHSCKPPIIHRDIKPDNIMRRKGDNKLFLIDFGGAKEVLGTTVMGSGTIASSMMGQDSVIIFTHGYAPIEQIKGKAKTVSDIYSLGATCVRLLTGCVPTLNKEDEIYDDDNEEWQWQEYLKRQGIGIKPQLAEIMNRMLERLPKNRYQSAQEILDILKPQPKPQPQQIISNPSPLSTPNYSPLKTFSFPVITVNDKGEEINRVTKSAQFLNVSLGNGVTMDFVSIPAGEFLMGSPESEAERNDRESPQHWVKVPAFFMGKYPVTQAQYEAVMGNNPSSFQEEENIGGWFNKKILKRTKPDRPVEKVSWNNCIEFCQKISQKLGKTCRLPSEAEWEYACRARTTTLFHFGATITTDLANFDGKDYTYASASKGIYRQETTDVGSFPPNAFGLYDMHGNVWEWCQDDYVDNYKGAPNDGSPRASSGNSTKVLRGGSWYNYPKYCRSASRNRDVADYVDLRHGFRLILGP